MVIHEDDVIGSSWDSPTMYNNMEQLVLDAVKESQTPTVPWEGTFNRRPATLAAMSTVKPNGRATQGALNRARSRTVSSAAKSLDILRKNLQSAINKEIDAVINKYLQKFFEPALGNIRVNLGPGSVSEDMVWGVCRDMLEEAKSMYLGPGALIETPVAPPPSPPPPTLVPQPEFEVPVPLQDQVTHQQPAPQQHQLTQHQPSPQQQQQQQQPQHTLLSDSAFDDINNIFPIQLEETVDMMTNEPELEITSKKQGLAVLAKWNPARVDSQTQFVLSTTAIKILSGLEAKTWLRQPELVKYNLDQDDKEWLFTACVPGFNFACPPNGLLLIEDLIEIANKDEYKHNIGLVLHHFKGFTVPDFMQRKVRAYMTLIRAKYTSTINFELLEVESNLGLGVDCVSSSMTPPSFMDTDLDDLQSSYLCFGFED